MYTRLTSWCWQSLVTATRSQAGLVPPMQCGHWGKPYSHRSTATFNTLTCFIRGEARARRQHVQRPRHSLPGTVIGFLQIRWAIVRLSRWIRVGYLDQPFHYTRGVLGLSKYVIMRLWSDPHLPTPRSRSGRDNSSVSSVTPAAPWFSRRWRSLPLSSELHLLLKPWSRYWLYFIYSRQQSSPWNMHSALASLWINSGNFLGH